MTQKRSMILASGGLKSTFLIGYCLREDEEVLLLFIDHDQANLQRELEAVSAVAKHYDCELRIDKVITPHGWPDFKLTYLWFHALMLAQQLECHFVCDGISRDDKRREAQLDYFDTLRLLVDKIQPEFSPSMHWIERLEIMAPAIVLTEGKVIRLGTDLGVPWELTWSCERGTKIHCGRCSHCQRRKWGFQRAKVEDPTTYRMRGLL